MIDHVRTLLLNPDGVPGYRRVSDSESDAVLELFGFGAGDDATAVDRVLPLAMAPDLAVFRRLFDDRVTPASGGSVYSQTEATLSVSGLSSRVLSSDGWWRVSALFSPTGSMSADMLSAMRAAASSHDAPYALGAVLLACAYRRFVLQGGGVSE